MATECISIIDPGGTGDYSSLSAWEADLGAGGTPAVTSGDLVTDDEIAIARCKSSDGSNDDNQFYPYGWTTGSGNEIKVEGTDFPTDGVWDETKYILEYSTGSPIIYIREDYVDITDIQVKLTYTGASQYGWYNVSANGNNCTITNCIFKNTSSNSNITSCIYYSDGNLVVKNSICIQNTTGTSYGIWCDGTTYIYNCTIYGADTGVRDGSSNNITIKNCAIGNNGDDFLGTFATIDYCCSDDGDGTNSQNPSGGSWANEFNDPGNDDFSLKSGGNCVNNGTDLSGVGVTDDIIGTARS